MEVNFLVRVLKLSARMDFLRRVKTFHRSKVTRLAFDRAHLLVLEWVLRNNCNCYLVLSLHFWTILTTVTVHPKICPFFEDVERDSEL